MGIPTAATPTAIESVTAMPTDVAAASSVSDWAEFAETPATSELSSTDAVVRLPAADVSLDDLASVFSASGDQDIAPAPLDFSAAPSFADPAVQLGAAQLFADPPLAFQADETLAAAQLDPEVAPDPSFVLDEAADVLPTPMVTILPSSLEDEDPPTLEIMASSLADLPDMTAAEPVAATVVPTDVRVHEIVAAMVEPAFELPALTRVASEDLGAARFGEVVQIAARADERRRRIARLESLLRKVQNRRLQLASGSVA